MADADEQRNLFEDDNVEVRSGTAENPEDQIFIPPSTIGSNNVDDKKANGVEKDDSVIKDHFTLPTPSSHVRFRKTNNNVRIFAANNTQFQLEEDFDERDKDGNHFVTAKRVNDSTTGLRVLRASYTLVCLFWTGFLVVFCIELLLFLILDMTIEIGITSKQDPDYGLGIGTILALPVYVHGLASALVIAGYYIQDTWNGHALVKKFVFGRFNGVLTEWVAFFVFLGLPLLVICFSLLSGSGTWWEISSLVWFSCVCLFYLVFAATVVFFENAACLEVMKNRYDTDVDTWQNLFYRAMILRQTRRYSGHKTDVYLAKGSVEGAIGFDEDGAMLNKTTRGVSESKMNLYSRFTRLNILSEWGFFTKLDPAVRVFTFEDAQGIRPYVTAKTWSLEKLYCRNRNARYVAIVKGPDRVTRAQLRSSFACAMIGNGLGLLLTISALVWLGMGFGAVIAVVVLVVLFGFLPGLRVSYDLYEMMKDLINAEDDDDEPQVDEDPLDRLENREAEEADRDAIPTKGPETTAAKENDGDFEDCHGIFQIVETKRVSEATPLLCKITFFFETLIFFLYPLVSLFLIGNYAISILFLFVGIFGAFREYLNPAVVLEEYGTMDLVDGEGEAKWQSQSRLNTIVSNITRSKAQKGWTSVLCIFLVAFLGLFGLAVTQTSDTTSDFQFTYLDDFEYPQQDFLEYPTCSIGKGLESLGTSESSNNMADYAFLAALAYRDTSITQEELNQWFGSGNASDESAFVLEYREAFQVTSAVSFKLITFPQSSLGIVAIRGTTNAWDALTDAQLWSSAAVFQGLRFLLPFGEIWTAIIDEMIVAISWLQSASIERVAFYKETSAFVNYLKNVNPLAYENVQVTGHSLGGGLSMITGAQTGTPAVALSGPNAKLSGKTFDPPVTESQLNTKVFNIIPDRDIVPRLDDRARLFQEIRCLAPTNDFVGCHDGRRSLCEIIHTCGTRGRPALCDCTTEFGYPEPTSISGRSFEDACADKIGAARRRQR